MTADPPGWDFQPTDVDTGTVTGGQTDATCSCKRWWSATPGTIEQKHTPQTLFPAGHGDRTEF